MDSCPVRTMTAVESVLSAIFCAVPAFRRVEPLKTSGPVGSTIAIVGGGEPAPMRRCW